MSEARRRKKPDPMTLLAHSLITGALAALPMVSAEFKEWAWACTAAVLLLSPVQGALKSWLGSEPAAGGDR